jgi:predicted acylesterase/phospholipase RssA
MRRLRSPALLWLVLVASCSGPARGPAVPEQASDRAIVLGLPGARSWGDRLSEPFIEELKGAAQREIDDLRSAGHDTVIPRSSFLALSGGSADGAFGAGLLCGWTASGTRPEFNLVTGVSTGALAAPFAFLGPDYDHKLREAYTSVRTSQVIRRRSILSILFDDALFDSSPLRRLVELMIDDDIVRDLAAEYARGRVLIVATTNLDANRSVFWNMTAIAASGQPGALDLIHDVLVASASIPAAFPPVMIDVTVDGRPHQEMHVDGAAKSQVFLFPTTLDLARHEAVLGVQRDRAAYIVRNARLEPQWEDVPRRTLAIARRAIEAAVRSQGLSDLFRIHVVSMREGIDFNLAYIPTSFTEDSTEAFDPEFMTQLFNAAYDMASAPGGFPWSKEIPRVGESATAPEADRTE